MATKYVDGPTPAMRALAASIAYGRFPFVGREMVLGERPFDIHVDASALWRYHLHYFDCLPAMALMGTAQSSVPHEGWRLVREWLRACPVGARPAWEPFPTAVRIANWAAAWGLSPSEAGRHVGLGVLARSLAMQGRWLARHIERHIGGNHLIKDARGLIVAGTVFAGEGDRWLEQGIALLRAELSRQVLPDGGHDERSPMYHAGVLEDVLDAILLARDQPVAAEFAASARAMAVWLESVRQPDGGLPQLNDTVAMPEPSPAWILSYAERVVGSRPPVPSRPGITALPASGIYVLRACETTLTIDCGEIGPPHLAAHAHADTLSYELSWGRERVVVDAGVAEYESGPLRSYVRSTAAHNTVTVSGQDQSEVWSSHRAGRRARPLGALAEGVDGLVRFAGAHDGYQRLGVVHHRHVLGLDETWIVVDELLGTGSYDFDSWIHLSPRALVEAHDGGAHISRLSGVPDLVVTPIGRCVIALADGRHCPDWGTVLPARALRIRARDGAPCAFGYAIAPAATPVALSLRTGPKGVALEGAVGDRSVLLTTERVGILRRTAA